MEGFLGALVLDLSEVAGFEAMAKAKEPKTQ